MIQKLKYLSIRLLQHVARKANYKFVLKNLKPLLELQHIHTLLETKRFFQLIDTVEMDIPAGKRITVIAPHTDDDIFGAGGTLLKAAAHGSTVDIIYLSNSAKDTDGVNQVIREATTICQRYGAHPHFLHYRPNNIPIDKADDLAHLILALSPDILFTAFFLDDNDDHRRANQLLLQSTSKVKLPAIEVWAYQIYSSIPANVVIDITEGIQEKITLMKIWENVRGDRDWVHYILGINMANCRYLKKRELCYGELFFVLPLHEYLDLCNSYFTSPLSTIYTNTRYHDT